MNEISEIRAVLFNKKVFSEKAAQKKMKELTIKYGLTPIKDMHETLGFYRYRTQPDLKQYIRTYTKPVHHGIEFIFGVRKTN